MNRNETPPIPASLAGACIILAMSLSGCVAVPAATGGGLYAAPAQRSPAYAFATPVSPIQPVTEPTDTQMSCDQLMAASVSMDQVIASDSAAAHPAPSAGLTEAVMHTAASMAVGALSSFAPGATYLSPAAIGLQQQQMSQQQFLAQSQAQSESQAQMAINNAEQRKMYLATLMQQKKCGQTSAAGG